ncbi:hypothetical protein [Oryzifoliimicrobium ureilyticus]|uniref:hypothetical protein n=1 Tax=Oryzifoliimicrobium ureilyticus TaxID=3113724 RepID=UPI0030767215
MIAEALLYAATLPLTKPEHRRFIRSSVSLWSRAGRCRKQWADHEKNTRSAILSAMASLPRRRTAVVLGSGLLRDVPIRQLAAAFDTVVLIDLVHLAHVRLRLRHPRYRHVRLIEQDLSGFSAYVSEGSLDPLGFLRNVPYLDFVVSANLLSQIGRGIMRKLGEDADNNAPPDTLTKLLRAHIDALQQAPWKTCLVSDVSYAVIDRNGNRQDEEDLLYGLTVPGAKAGWYWPVVPFGEESADYQIIHKVVASF